MTAGGEHCENAELLLMVINRCLNDHDLNNLLLPVDAEMFVYRLSAQ